MRRAILGREFTSNSSGNRSVCRRLFERRRCLAPLTLNGEDHNDESLVKQSSSYMRLTADRLIRISIMKLDGSLFDVHVARNGTVAELKQAVEAVFTSYMEEAEATISWSHVWGHFCLCYQGQKLMSDKVLIKNLGIKDGDQLKFIRHMSINYSPLKRRSKVQNLGCIRYLELPSGTNALEKKQAPLHETNSKNEYREGSSEYCPPSDGQDEQPPPEFKLSSFLKGWLSYSRLWGVSKRGSEKTSRPSRFGPQLFR